jgi:hypothetical protein
MLLYLECVLIVTSDLRHVNDCVGTIDVAACSRRGGRAVIMMT